MPRLRHIFGALLCILILGVRCAPAQQTPDQPQDQPQDQTQDQTQDQGQVQPAQPIPAIRSPLASAAGNNSGQLYPDQLQPDTNPLAGVQDLSLGDPVVRNNWQPHADLFAGATSNALNSTVSTGWTLWSYILGGVALHRVSGVQHLFVNYTGGGVFTGGGGQNNNGVYQALNLADQFKLRRFTLTFLEQFSYSPEASLGAGGFSDLNGSLGLGSSFTPSQGILTTRDQNLNNTFLTQLDAHLSRRSSLTFAGGYSLLHYFNNTNLSYGDVLFRSGYNYQMTRKDTIALIYQFSGLRYSNFDQSINLNTIHVSYGRRATGRLAFQVAAGPEFAHFQTPITSSVGGAGSGSPTTSSTNQTYFSFESSLQYAFNRTNVAASYSHGVSGGGGVLAGALADTVSGTVSRQWARTWNANGTIGYSRNSGLGVVGNTTPNHQTYDYWFAGVGFSHPWGRELSLQGLYHLQYQNSNSSFCVGVTCGTNIIVHQFSFGVNWRRQPIPF